jgi:hypothetical protein
MFQEKNTNLKIRLELIAIAGKALPQIFCNEGFYPHYRTSKKGQFEFTQNKHNFSAKSY